MTLLAMANPAGETWVWLAIILILVGVVCILADRWMDRPLTDYDEFCSRMDQEIDDELAARRALRPSGSVGNVVPLYPRERGGDVA